MPSSLASTLGRKDLCPPTLIPRKKTIKAMLPIVAHRSIEEKRKRSGLRIDNVWPSLSISVNSPNHMLGRIRVAVGTTIADRPPHRSVRALLAHTAPTSDAWRGSVRWDKDAEHVGRESSDPEAD